MPEINIVAVVVAAVGSFIASGVWYALLGNAMVRLQGQWRGASAPEQPKPWQFLVYFATAVIIALVVAVVMGLADISGWAASAGFGLLLWVGFCLTQWISSIVGEDVPLRLAAIHAGDWLLHLLIIATVVGVWR